MRRILLLSLTVMLLFGVKESLAGVDVSFSANFSELADYGEWVIVPGYGTVWRPDADPSWRPFTYGHWVYSDDGWLWDSDEPFGWIVCHYGKWAYDDDEGWIWLPGYEWSPAQVRWYVTDDEIGWAPLFAEPRRGRRPHAFQLQWNFAPLRLFTSVEVRSHLAVRVGPEHGRVRVHTGSPRRDFIQRRLGTPIVNISYNKVRVTTRAKPLVRVEVRNREQPIVVVPVGPKYRRSGERVRPESRSNAPSGKIHADESRDLEDNDNFEEDKQKRKKVKVRINE